MTEVSHCCKARLIDDFKENFWDHDDPIEIYTCETCKQECDVEEVCDDCLGTGEIVTDEDDGEGHVMRGVGNRKCHCQTKEKEFDNQE